MNTNNIVPSKYQIGDLVRVKHVDCVGVIEEKKLIGFVPDQNPAIKCRWQYKVRFGSDEFQVLWSSGSQLVAEQEQPDDEEIDE